MILSLFIISSLFDLVAFLIIQSLFWSINWQKNPNQNFRYAKVTCSNVLFSLNSNKYRDISFYSDTQQGKATNSHIEGILGIFGLKHYFDDCLIMKMVAHAVIFVSIKYFINQLNVSAID